MSYKIAHISDTHLKFNDSTNYIMLSKLLRDISRNGCEHLLISGDIVDNASKREYEIVRRKLEEYDYLDSTRLSVVPGNHDIYGGTAEFISGFEFPAHCRDLDYDKKEFDFFNFFNESFRDTIRKSGVFPFIKTLKNNVIIAGLNSVAGYSEKNNPLGTNGEISEGQLKNLKKLFKEIDTEGKLKIVLIHHYFSQPDHNKDEIDHALWLKSEHWKMKLHNRKQLAKEFRDLKIDIVLHGHNHITESYQMNNVLYLNSSGCIRPFTKLRQKEYHIINYIPDEKKFSIETSFIY